MDWLARVADRLAASPGVAAEMEKRLAEENPPSPSATTARSGATSLAPAGPFADLMAQAEAVDQRLRQIEARHAGLASYTEEGIARLHEWMQARGVTDYAAAVPAFERENPPPPPIETGSSHFVFHQPNDDPKAGLDLLLRGDEDGFLEKQIGAALRDVRGVR